MREAKWIWLHGADHPDEYGQFTRTFVTEGKAVSMEISCDGNYEAYVNGRLAAFGQYADFPYAKVFDRIDLTEYCREGENTLSVLVWYLGADCFTYYKGQPGLIYEITEGDEIRASSDHTTLCCGAKDYRSGRQKEITDQLGFSYTYDCRGYNGWKEKAFQPLDYAPATEVEGRCESLRPRPNQKLRLKPFVPAVLIDEEKQIYDLGEETVGYLGLRFRAPMGALITVSYGEHLVLAEDGTEEVPRIIGKRDFSVELIANGERVDFSNYLRRLGGRYFQISCAEKVEVARIGLYPAEYPLRVLPFDAGNPLRRRIYETCIRTLRFCMFEHYEDCPWREQSFYTLDSRNQMLCGYYAFGEYEFPRSALSLFGQDRSDTGLLHICAPSKRELYIPFFSLIYVIQMEEYLRFSSDASLAAEFYEKMRELLRTFTDREEDGLVPNFPGDKRFWNFYEWSDTLNGYPRGSEEKRFELVLNAALSLALGRMAVISERLDRKDDAASYRARAERLNARINETFYSDTREMYRTIADTECYSQVGNAFAILCGAAEGKRGEAACRHMLTDSDVVTATLSMKAFLYDALLAVDRETYGTRILTDIDRLYGYMLNCGATSFWETIKGAEDFHNAGSLCHGWSAIPIVYYHLLLS